MTTLAFVLLASLVALVQTQKIVLTNDDGWAEAQIRAQFEELVNAGYETILSAPAINQSGRGSLSVPAIPLLVPCEYNSCKIGSPAEGFNQSDPRLNYVNAAPSDAAHYGINTLAPAAWGTKPDLVVSGPNIGYNAGIEIVLSGTVGAASRSISEGTPAVSFSGSDASNKREAWTDLVTAPTSPSIVAARTYSKLTTTFLKTLFSQPNADSGLLPNTTLVNVNYPPITSNCSATPEIIKWVLARAYSPIIEWKGKDVSTCGNNGQLPLATDVLGKTSGCYATVTVLNASTKGDATSDVQADVLQRLAGLGFSCAS